MYKRQEYMPAAAEIDMNKHRGMARAVNACLDRQEFRAFTANFSSCGMETTHTGSWTRWPSIAQQKENTEIWLRGTGATCDSIYNNMVPMKSYWGPMQCPYCYIIIVAGSVLDIFKHLSTRHADLPEQWFTCPTCIGPIMLRAQDYMGHWLVVHEASSFMRHSCDDLQTGQRVAFGEALFAWLGARDCLLYTSPSPRD